MPRKYIVTLRHDGKETAEAGPFKRKKDAVAQMAPVVAEMIPGGKMIPSSNDGAVVFENGKSVGYIFVEPIDDFPK